MRFLDEKFQSNKTRFIAQSVLAGCAVAAALMIFDVVHQPMIIASFGASTFIAFTRPHHAVSGPRYLVGGYLVGALVGCAVHSLTFLTVEEHLAQNVLYVLAGGMAVAFSMFFMTIFNTEHAPAAGIALGLAINEWLFLTVTKIMIGIVIISLIQRLTRRWMIDLL